MSLYYFNKYVATETTTYSNPDASWTLIGLSSGRISARPNYSFTAGTTGWSTSGTPTNAYDTFIYYKSDNTRMLMYYNYGDGNYHWWYKDCDSDINYSQGALIEANIIAEDGTYPDDGYQAGYWWVKGALVPTSSGFLALF